MRLDLLLLIVSAAAVTVMPNTATCAYSCTNSYAPARYIGNPRVPTNCGLETISPACPRSWKSGVPRGQSASLPLIDVNFVQCHEGFTCCGYVPINSRTGQVLGQSGVTVGSGVDLGSKTSDSLRAIGVSQNIVDQLEQYFGLRTDRAACAAVELPLRMNCSDVQVLTEDVKNDVVRQVQQRYDRERRSTNTDSFNALPRGIRTAVADVWFQFGILPNSAPRFWGYVIRNDWDNAIRELRNFYGLSANPPSGDIRRRNNEADIIEAALARCNRSIDAVFLIDESGSISPSSFISSLRFIRSVIDAFPNENLRGENGTRFGLALFNSGYRDNFYLSSYSSKSQYFAALSSVRQGRGGTRLGNALNQILPRQFTESLGLRPGNYGLPRILIVLTDGQSGDAVAAPAARLRDQNIVIYAIGVGGYDLTQLNAVASSQDMHVHFLSSFARLSDFAATLTASTCYEPQPIPLESRIDGRVEKDAFQYYEYNILANVNLRVEVNDSLGSTLVYASRDNPHPYDHNNDLGFSLASQANKTIVISPIVRMHSESKKRQVSVNGTQPIYISVTGVSSNTAFTLLGSTCDPTECMEGTNESGVNIMQASMAVILIAAAIATITSLMP